MMKSVLVAIACALTTLTLQAAPKKDAGAGDKKPTKGKKDTEGKKPAKGKKGPEAAFKKADTDGNGSLNESEFVTARTDAMKMGLEKAGKTDEEITATLEKRAKSLPKMFAKIDTNGDGAVTLEELKNAPKPAPKKEK